MRGKPRSHSHLAASSFILFALASWAVVAARPFTDALRGATFSMACDACRSRILRRNWVHNERVIPNYRHNITRVHAQRRVATSKVSFLRSRLS